MTAGLRSGSIACTVQLTHTKHALYASPLPLLCSLQVPLAKCGRMHACEGVVHKGSWSACMHASSTMRGPTAPQPPAYAWEATAPQGPHPAALYQGACWLMILCAGSDTVGNSCGLAETLAAKPGFQLQFHEIMSYVAGTPANGQSMSTSGYELGRPHLPVAQRLPSPQAGGVGHRAHKLHGAHALCRDPDLV